VTARNPLICVNLSFVTAGNQAKILDFELAKLLSGTAVSAVARASRPGQEASHGQDARATAGETPALQDSPTGPWPGLGWVALSDWGIVLPWV
jgi:hypothetical protein